MNRLALRHQLLMAFCVCALRCAPLAVAQTPADRAAVLRDELIGYPLYLRGFWNGYDLHFDAAGEPIGKVTTGPMTLSGIDITDVAIEDHRLHLKGARVVLVANEAGRLERRTSLSVTGMPLTLQRRYISKDLLSLTVEPDKNGDFRAALIRIFVEGDAGLASVAPSPWKCYAGAFLTQQLPDAEAQARVTECVHRVHFDHSAEPGYIPPSPPDGFSVQVATHQPGSLGLAGTSRIHCTIGPHGFPTRLQVEQPVGAGVDENVLQALSRATFRPATVEGLAQPQDFDLRVELKPEP